MRDTRSPEILRPREQAFYIICLRLRLRPACGNIKDANPDSLGDFGSSIACGRDPHFPRQVQLHSSRPTVIPLPNLYPNLKSRGHLH
jgi:hypothetical protein